MGFWKWMKEGLKEEAERQKNISDQNKSDKKDFKNKVRQMEKEGIAHCPKCKSTSIQYVERRKALSIGRGIVGSTINPLAGAVGAVTSKKYKGFVKCLNCGYQWKK